METEQVTPAKSVPRSVSAYFSRVAKLSYPARLERHGREHLQEVSRKNAVKAREALKRKRDVKSSLGSNSEPSPSQTTSQPPSSSPRPPNEESALFLKVSSPSTSSSICPSINSSSSPSTLEVPNVHL